MPAPDALVRLRREGTDVRILTPGVVAEVHDYIATLAGDRPGELIRDENGKLFARYAIGIEDTRSFNEAVARGLSKFAEDLHRLSGTELELTLADGPDGLHVLTIGKTEYFFHAATGVYDGWGKFL